ncbi:hypothetical protein [Actinokineospora fastidiosa]|uniref:Uncharacterized protein n=1 Tax=Actinokineospora fastidiosa TaxID=1816 RepID=A0A918GQF5_9PSEU|nr:hypothetical protein [Actinokineospora fastidiosa]GGS52402.1 hypothetical protein GCM10010171_54350 [Actinokineospora fastidiosa]
MGATTLLLRSRQRQDATEQQWEFAARGMVEKQRFVEQAHPLPDAPSPPPPHTFPSNPTRTSNSP